MIPECQSEHERLGTPQIVAGRLQQERLGGPYDPANPVLVRFGTLQIRGLAACRWQDMMMGGGLWSAAKIFASSPTST